jgi:serine/threonine protein kinase
MATVTLAEDTVLGRSVALKRVYRTGDSRDMLRLKREAMVGASLNHPNLVFVYDVQLQDDGDVVIVMEYVEGETLADLIGSHGALIPSEAIRVLRGVGAALDAIHERGIVHRDVKPANVLLGRDGAVKLADLGVADVPDRTHITTADSLVGSFSYMAPEQLDGAPPSPAMDVYALAAMAYETLAGEKARPESNPLALAHTIATQPPPDLRRARPTASAQTAAVLQRGMAADPVGRPESAGEFVRQLEASLQTEQAARAVPPARTSPRRSLVAPFLLALAALAVAAVIVVALAGGGGTSHSGTSTSRGTARRTPSHTTTHPATTAHSATPAQSATAATPSNGAAAPSTGASAAATPPASGAPASAVEQFYEAAARHQYATAWALADSNLRNQLGGYASFQHEMSAVRSITFHSAQVVSGSGSDTATVALSTTSVQTDRTQQCSGTASTVRSADAWLVDRISISCSGGAP